MEGRLNLRRKDREELRERWLLRAGKGEREIAGAGVNDRGRVGHAAA